MALSTSNFSVIESGVIGDLRYVIATMTGDSSYSTGGSSVTPAMLGFTVGILGFQIAAIASAGSSLMVPLKQTDGSFKLKIYTALTPTEKTNATSDATNTYHVFAVGR